MDAAQEASSPTTMTEDEVGCTDCSPPPTVAQAQKALSQAKKRLRKLPKSRRAAAQVRVMEAEKALSKALEDVGPPLTTDLDHALGEEDASDEDVHLLDTPTLPMPPLLTVNATASELAAQAFGILDGDIRKFSRKKANELKELIQRMEILHLRLVQQSRLGPSADHPSPVASPKLPSPSMKTFAETLAVAKAVPGHTCQAASQTTPQVDPRRTLQVFPRKPTADSPNPLCSSQATMQLLKCVNLSGLNVGIRSMKPIPINGVSVQCRNEDEVRVLGDAIRSDHPNTLSVRTPTRKKPTFSLFLPGTDHDPSSLHQEICDKNPGVLEKEDFSVVHVSRTKNGNSIAFLEVSGPAYRRIMEHDCRVYVDWICSSLREQEPVSQCFRCFKFGHKARTCLNPTKLCPLCGQSHDSDACLAKMKSCVNCVAHNSRALRNGQPRFDSQHSAMDKRCELRMKTMNQAKLLIEYD